jgi:hypothetical protein
MVLNSAYTRICGALAVLGASLWALSWTFNTEDNSLVTFGLGERGWRRLLDPALAFMITALIAYRRRYSWPGSRVAVLGWSVAILGLLTTLAGNVIEFWIGELLYVDVQDQFEPTDHLGWALFLWGWMILSPSGFVVLGVAHFQSRIVLGWRRILPFLMGVLPTLLMPVAIVDQDALGTVILVFGLGWVMLGYDLWSSPMPPDNAFHVTSGARKPDAARR